MCTLTMSNDEHISKQVAAELRGKIKQQCADPDCTEWLYIPRNHPGHMICSACANKKYTPDQLKQMDYYEYGSRVKYND